MIELIHFGRRRNFAVPTALSNAGMKLRVHSDFAYRSDSLFKYFSFLQSVKQRCISVDIPVQSYPFLYFFSYFTGIDCSLMIYKRIFKNISDGSTVYVFSNSLPSEILDIIKSKECKLIIDQTSQPQEIISDICFQGGIENTKAVVNDRKQEIDLAAGFICGSDILAANVRRELAAYNATTPVFSVPYGYFDMPSTFVSTGDSKSILFVGRWEWLKGVDILICVAKNYPEYKFYVAGTSFIKGAPDNILFLGKLTSRELKTYYRKCFFLFAPTRLEGASSVIFEAVANGCRLITNHMAGVPPSLEALSLLSDENTFDEYFKLFSSLEFHSKENVTVSLTEFTLQSYGLRLKEAIIKCN